MGKDFNKEVGKRLFNARKAKEMTRAELGRIICLHESTIKRYEDGEIKSLDVDKMKEFAKALNTTPAYLMGWEDEKENSLDNLPDNIIPLPKTKKIPLVGEIACGVSILAEENIQEYISCPDGIHADFCLRCKGDSMIGSRIHDGDIVFIRKQATVENGEIAAVLINHEATLKKVYVTSSKITLRDSNPLYEDIVLDSENEVHILGLAVAFFSSLQKQQAASAKPKESEIEVYAARNGDTSELNEEGKKAAKKLFDDWDNL